ncbi:MAG: type III-A CRISPR-associated protein Csm2 [Lachnospiraceae bacterium]
MTADIYNQVLTSQKENLNEDLNGRIEYLRVRFMYECGREPKVNEFVQKAQILDILKEIKQSKKNYLLFSRYMEALIAFHRYYGGRDE